MSDVERTSAHAADRMVDRTEADLAETAPRAWERGLAVGIPEESPVPPHDEARFDPETHVVIFRREKILTTAYGLESEHLTNVIGVATAAAVDAQYGTDYLSGVDPRNLELIK